MSNEKELIQNEEIELTAEEIGEQRQIRREKLKKLQEAGRNPFLMEKWNVTDYSKNIIDNFDEMEGKEVSCAGRIMAKRDMGKASFIDILDNKGRIQVYVRKDAIGEEDYNWFKTYDIGDIVGLVGDVFKTKNGEISIKTKELVLLTKSLQVLPNKWQGLKDTDLRYRQRYVDLIMNQDVKAMFYKRSSIIKEVKKSS